MEQQQCPICMLYLLPGMNLQDHLDTHPKDMIIKALLSAKPEPPKPVTNSETAATVFLTTSAPFSNHSPATHVYQDQQNGHQHNNFTLAKRQTPSNSNTVMFNNRPYRLTIDAPQTVTSPTTATTFLNTNASNYGSRATTSDADLFDNSKAFRCIQNTEQKNIMIVNTSSTQFIQQTLPVKKQPAAIELHPVIIDSTGMPISTNNVPSAISIIPRYTSEKYSGPPPSYSTAISSVTNTINDKPRVIDLTQTPTISTMKMMEKQSNNNNNGNKMTTTLSGNSASDENRHLMITTAPQKILEYTQNENGDFMITEKMVPTHEEEIVEEVTGENNEEYSIKFVDIGNQVTFDITEADENGKFNHGDQFVEIDEDVEVIDDGKELSYKPGTSKNHHGVKVLSNVKLTSSEMFSPTIKDIIQQYNNQTERIEEKPEAEEAEMKEETQEDESFSLIQCTETLNLSKEGEESASACASVIKKTVETEKSDEPQPSTSGCVTRKSNVFNLNPTNRLKLNKQPKKLIVKLKKPLVEVHEEQEEPPKVEERTEEVSIKSEIVCEKAVIVTEVETKPETHFDTSFLEHHDYEHVNTIEVTPEIHHDSETNQSLMSMDLEPETGVVKREQIEDDFPVVIKTEHSSTSSSSATSTSNSQSSCSNSCAGPSRLTIESVPSTNENSPLNFLYQNDRVRFSPPLSPYVYLKTFSSSQSDDPAKQEVEMSWNGNTLQNSDQNSTSSRYTPSFDDNRSNYTDLDGGNNKTSSSACDGQIRAPSTDSLNIRTDEKMPARGEISEQESNGEIEQPWHHPYFQLQAYPSSYDMSTAQECWNLSKADSQNACDSNNIQNVIINFPPLNAQSEDIKTPDLLKTIMQTVTKQEPPSIDDEASGSNSNIILKRNRTFRCPECSKFFVKLRARNRHIEQVHPHLRRTKKIKTAPTSTQTSKSETSVFASSSSALATWTATATSSQEQEVKVLSIIKNEPSTSAAVLVKNEMNRMLISTTGSIKMEMDRLLLEPSTSSTSQLSTLGLKIKRTYMCAKCNEQFRTLKLLDKHFQIHPAECTLCQKTFNSWNTFSLHLKHHLNIRVHACRFCPKRFVQRQRLVEHERVHTGSMPIKCPHCDERFRRYSNMLHHRARVHLNKKAKQEDFVCHCGEIFQTKAKLEWHQETHENKPKPCPYCRERFTHRNSLTRHIRLSHTDKYVFTKSKAVNCPICNSTYLPSSIKAHMATHQISNKEFSCTICSKQFSTKWNLKQHHWTHANRSTKPFQCNVCPSAFVRETDYTTHMNAHRSIKPFTCNTCGKRFVRKYNWLRHSREHEREKKFECETCKKKFHRAYYLTEHKRVHTGERPFSCTICGKTSATKTNHNKHIKIHHARDPLTAEG